jgi:transketolase
MRTVKGRGISYMEKNASWHGKAPNDEQYKLALSELRAHLAGLEGE